MLNIKIHHRNIEISIKIKVEMHSKYELQAAYWNWLCHEFQFACQHFGAGFDI